MTLNLFKTFHSEPHYFFFILDLTERNRVEFTARFEGFVFQPPVMATSDATDTINLKCLVKVRKGLWFWLNIVQKVNKTIVFP